MHYVRSAERRDLLGTAPRQGAYLGDQRDYHELQACEGPCGGGHDDVEILPGGQGRDTGVVHGPVR